MREPAARRYSRYKYRASKKGIPWDLTLKEFALITAMPCHNCGSYDRVGVDRMDDTGYHIHTTMPLCWLCNARKTDMGMEQWQTTTGGRAEKFFERRRRRYGEGH